MTPTTPSITVCTVFLVPIRPPAHRPEAILAMSHKNRHRLDDGRDDRALLLGHDDDSQRLDSAPTPPEINGVVGRHCDRGCFGLRILHHDMRPSWAQHVQHLATVYAIVDHQYQRPAIASDHPCESNGAPSPPVSCRSVANVPEATAEPTNNIG